MPIPAEHIYLDGNSLGRLPRAAVTRLDEVIRKEWGQALIDSWPQRWWDLSVDLGAQIASLVGAAPSDVVVADSTSVLLFKATLGALLARPERDVIITDDLNFPTDNYVTAAAAELAGGRQVLTVASEDGIHGPEDAIVEAIDARTAIVTLSHVAFKSGYRYDMDRITGAAHAVGALVLWDLSHSVGAMPIELAARQVDLAVGCTYKYLNGGPGSPAFLYVNSTRLPELRNPLHGWWGHASPFSFDLDYRPAPSIRRFQTGTMPILSLSAIEPALQLVVDAGTDAIRRKSEALTEFFVEQADSRLVPLGFTVATPRRIDRRGSHVSLRHPAAWQLSQAMVDVGRITPDFREPDNIRFGMAPLYTTFIEVDTAIGRIERIARTGLYEGYPVGRRSVT